jgi:hypothetical protein
MQSEAITPDAHDLTSVPRSGLSPQHVIWLEGAFERSGHFQMFVGSMNAA